jgi:hypothetical protein
VFHNPPLADLLPVRHRRPLSTFGLAALVVLAGGCGPRETPFELFRREDMRAGVAFSDLDAAAISEQKQPWACKAIWAEARSCWLRVEAGMMTALIGSNGKVVRLIYVTDEPVRGLEDHGYRGAERRSILRNEIDFMRMSWDAINPHRMGSTDQGYAEYRWTDSSGRWTAGLWYSPMTRYLPRNWAMSLELLRDTLAFVPDSMAVTDERAYAELLDKRPPVALSVTAGGALLPGRPLTPGEQFEIMRGDLALFRDAQAEYRDGKSGYATNQGELMFLERDGVTIKLLEASTRGWSALATHTALPGTSCVLHVGRVKAPARTLHANLQSRADEIVCDGSPYGGGVASR